jgi:hypothetical protein
MPLARIPTKERVLQIWEPLAGHDAATKLFRCKWVLGVTPVLAVADFVVVFLAARVVHHGAAWVAFVAVLVLVSFAASSYVFLRQYQHAASEALGVKVTSKNNPPSDQSSYYSWCRSNGVVPLNSRAKYR